VSTSLLSYLRQLRLNITVRKTIEIETVTDGRRSIIKGRAVQVEGRAATLHLHNSFEGRSVRSIVTVGKESLTTAEGQREKIVLDAFRESNSLLSMPFVRLIWLPLEQPDWLTTPRLPRPKLPVIAQTERLNPSQQTAVQAIVSEASSDRFVLIQGPPGTGKTTVIACATRCMIEARSRHHTVWLIAQSNVAVKNIAEKLAKDDFFDFKLLVSREFHFDWCVNCIVFQSMTKF
jgi:primosomal protein N'